MLDREDLYSPISISSVLSKIMVLLPWLIHILTLSAKRDKQPLTKALSTTLVRCASASLKNSKMVGFSRSGVCKWNAAFVRASSISMAYGILDCRGQACNSILIASVIVKTILEENGNLNVLTYSYMWLTDSKMWKSQDGPGLFKIAGSWRIL